jgi:2'-5' RNA ligase
MGSYSLWMVPKGPLLQRLHKEIIHLASTSGLKDNGAPSSFVPHVTLLGGIQRTEQEVLDISKRLAQHTSPFKITLDRVSIGNHFHQCIYILCERSGSLLAAGAAARSAFGLDPTDNYMPHLSLTYADETTPTSTKEYIAGGLQAALLESHHGLPEKEFTADSVQIWYTPAEDRTLESWKLVVEYAFG